MNCYYYSSKAGASYREHQGSLKHRGLGGGDSEAVTEVPSACSLCSSASVLRFLPLRYESSCMFRKLVPPLWHLETIRYLCWLQGLVLLCFLNQPFAVCTPYPQPTFYAKLVDWILDHPCGPHSFTLKRWKWKPDPAHSLLSSQSPLIAGARPSVSLLPFSTHNPPPQRLWMGAMRKGQRAVTLRNEPDRQGCNITMWQCSCI